MAKLDGFLHQLLVVWERLPSAFLWGHDSTGLWFAITLFAHLLLFSGACHFFGAAIAALLGPFIDPPEGRNRLP